MTVFELNYIYELLKDNVEKKNMVYEAMRKALRASEDTEAIDHFANAADKAKKEARDAKNVFDAFSFAEWH